MLDGDSVLITSGDAFTVNVSVLVVPYVGSLTETVAFPDFAMSDAGTCAVNCELLTKVVGSELPFQSTVDC